MKSFSFAKALVVGSLLCLALPVACGDSENNPVPNPNVGGEANGGEPGRTGGEPGTAGGEGGAAALPPGISLTPTIIDCGGDCESASVGFGAIVYYIEPCCAAGDVCGLSTEFLGSVGATSEETCQPKNQPGELDEACPSPEASMIPAGDMTITLDAFPGCCLPSGVCGVAVNDVTYGGGIVPLGSLEMGCVEAAPFFPGEDPVACGEGAGGSGAGGSGSTAGAPATNGGDGAGGAGGGN